MVPTKSDEQLLAEHRNGVQGAFDELVARHAGELFAFVVRFVANAAAADDVVQDAFVQVHVSAAAFDQQRSFKPWLYTIAANKARDYLRTRSRRQELSLESSTGDEDNPGVGVLLESDEPTSPELLDADDDRTRVQRLVAGMPEHLRMILVLGYYQQMAYADIAVVLDIPVGTVKSRLHAAVNHFAKLWRAATKASAGSPPTGGLEPR